MTICNTNEKAILVRLSPWSLVYRNYIQLSSKAIRVVIQEVMTGIANYIQGLRNASKIVLR